MTRSIHLLGKPRVVSDVFTVRRPRGRKVWAVLAYLLLSEGPVPRGRLVDLLFQDCDDPLRTLRWNVSEIRHAIGIDVVGEAELRIEIPPGTWIDVVALERATWVEAVAVPEIERPLLEACSYPGAHGFEAWLSNRRASLAARAASVLREGAYSQLGAGRIEQALELALRLTQLDPYDEPGHALFVRCLGAAGRSNEAAHHVALVTEMFERDLGESPTDELSDAIKAVPGAGTSSPATGTAGVRALLEAADAALQAGAIDAGLECYRRAAAEAHCTGDARLKAHSLLSSGAALIHSGRGRQVEGATALHSAIAIAEGIGEPTIAASAYRELAWVELMAGRAPTMDRLLDKALALSGDDPELAASVLVARGWGQLETGHYATAQAVLQEAEKLARSAGDVLGTTWALTILSGVHVKSRRLAQARTLLDEATELSVEHGLNGFSPVPAGKLAELELAEGRVDIALTYALRASSTAHRLADPCMISLADRELGLARFTQGDVDQGISLLGNARMYPLRVLDSQWKSAHALDALCSVAVALRLEQASTWIDDLESIAARTGMTELVAHAYLHRSAMGDEAGSTAAAAIAAEVDNPYLHHLISAA